MVRNYISPEFKFEQVFGTFNMEEESSYFGSKMLEIEDSLRINNESLVYYQNSNNEQLDLQIEYDFIPKSYNTVIDKQANHTLILDDTQTEVEKNNYAKWVMVINIKNILRNYLFATLKKYRTFEGVSNSMTYDKNVDFAIRDYIERNVVNRYKFSGVDLYIVPIDLLIAGSLKYQNVWDNTIESDEYKFTKFSTITDFKYEDIKLMFSQNFSASQYAFRYYFNLKFDKL